MTKRMNSKSKVVKVISLVLSIYMAVSPMVVYADELADAENDLLVQSEVRDEAAECVKEAVDNAVIPEAQVEFEIMVADVDVSDIDSRNPLEDTSVLVQEEIDRIENDAVKEVTDAIVNVDMSYVDEALNTVTELIDNSVTDEVVASEIETAADTLISVYNAQAEIALNTLTVISEESEAVTVLEDGSVSVDWDKATEEVKTLEGMYQKAASDLEIAQSARNEAIEKQQEAIEKQQEVSNKVDELNNGIINENKEINEKVSETKLNKNNDINSIIETIATNNDKPFTTGTCIDQKNDESSDMYRFYVNTVRDGIAYGCLTYYDSESKTILRKNFSISASGEIDYNYVPKAEWVKKDPNCKEVIFGNSSNYVAAYVGNKNLSNYISNGKFNGTNVSDIMRENEALNSAIDARNEAIDARNEAINELKKIEVNVAAVEKELENATNEANEALNKYKEAVAMYKDVASLENEIKENEVEIAMLEYVKAEVEVFRKQQVLDQVKETLKESNVPNPVEKNREEEPGDVEKVEKDREEEPGNIKKAEKNKVGQQKKYERVETNREDELENIETVEIYGADDQVNIEEVVNNIASNLGVEPEVVEAMVVETMIETENSFYGVANDVEKEAVAGVIRDAEDVDGVVEEVTVKTAPENEISEDIIEIQNDTMNGNHEVVTIEDEMVPLAATIANVDYSVNWWLPLAIASIYLAWMMFIVVKENQEEKVEID